MRGHWHVVAMAACASMLASAFKQYWVLGLCLLWLCYLFLRLKQQTILLVLTLASLLFFTFYIPSWHVLSDATPLPSISQPITGTVSSALTLTPAKLEFQLKEQEYGINIQIVHFFDLTDETVEPYQQVPMIKHGATCTIEGDLSLPQESRNPGQFDYRAYLAKQGVHLQVIVPTLDRINCEGSAILNHLYALRMSMMSFTYKRLSPDSTAWLNALILGDDSFIADDVIDLFRRWSLSHLLAISGLHVGLVIAVIYFLLVKLSIATKETAQWLMMVFLPLYAFIAGGEPSVWRACLMALSVIILHKCHVKLSYLDVLSIVFMLLIISDPYIVYHIGFQFSFLVTCSLILSRSWLRLSESRVYQVLQISFISQMIIIPIQLAYFYTFQPLSILLNVVVVPYFSLFVIPYLLLLLLITPLPFVGLFDHLFISIHQRFLWLLENVDQHFHFPLYIGDVPVAMFIIYYVVLMLWMGALEVNKLGRAIKYGVLLCSLTLFLFLRPYLSPYGVVTMLDIGQGDAFVIELPYRRGVILLDAGAQLSFVDDYQLSDRVYRQILKPYFQSRGIYKIDAIIISHEDADHQGSVPFIVAEMPVSTVIVSEFYQLDDVFVKVFGQHEIEVIRLANGDRISIAGQTFTVLSPMRDVADANENSLVLLTEFGGKRWLFTGDIGEMTEKALIRAHPDLRIDVLKVAHHGSNTSTDASFMNAVKPTYGLISVGLNNRYGHPAPEVIDVLNEYDTFILRTDHHGAVQYRFTQHSGTFSIYRPYIISSDESHAVNEQDNLGQ